MAYCEDVNLHYSCILHSHTLYGIAYLLPIMNISIIGAGIVGQATRLGLSDEHVIRYHDPMLELTCDYVNSDVVFVCVPTDLDPQTGNLNIGIVESYLRDLEKHRYVYIRSTIPHTLVSGDCKFAVVPEYLREASWETDASNPSHNLIGGNTKQKQLLENITKRKYRKTTPEIAALSKMAMNSFLALKVHYANILYTHCQTHNLDYNMVKQCMLLDERLYDSHMDVPGPDGALGFGGKCLPKDLSALATLTGNDVLDLITVNNFKIRNNEN